MHNDAATSKPAIPATAPAADPGISNARRIASKDLFSGAREIIIEHDGRQYRLRITQNGKLILTA